MKKNIVFIFLLVSSFANITSGQGRIGSSTVSPRMRVIVDNDFSGDPDGMFQLAHLLLSPSVDVRAIIGSHLRPGDGFDPSQVQAQNAAAKANELLQVMNLNIKIPVVAGSNIAMVNEKTPVKSEGVNLIIEEALRTDVKTPLYILCGAGLTEIASALLTKPEIADKIILVWIGGPEYLDLALPPPNYSTIEYNMNIDLMAARVVFNSASIQMWQVPRNAYRQAILPYSQLLLHVKPHGKLGEYLTGELEKLMIRIKPYVNIGETYILGDSPLVLLTALQSSFEADPSSSYYSIKPSPKISQQGQYEYNHTGRNIRVYTLLDCNLMFNDFFAKLKLANP
jgi:purine nucleosidase